MGRQVLWTDKMTKSFAEKALLSEDEIKILETRARGYTVTQQSEMFHKSSSTVNRMIREIKKKYEIVQKEYPDEFPPMKKSKVEEFMDNN